MAGKPKDHRLNYAIARFDSWGDWKIEGGWDYTPKPVDATRVRMNENEHSDPVISHLIATEMAHRRDQATDLIYNEHMWGLTRRIIWLRYVDKMGNWVAIMDKALEELRGDFTSYGSIKRNSEQYIRLMRERANRQHTEACYELLDRIDQAARVRDNLTPAEIAVLKRMAEREDAGFAVTAIPG